jgi:signal transduction histidine kinase
MQVAQPRSLRRLLLTHDLAFLVLVAVTGVLGGFWAYFWQQTSVESVRLNGLAHIAQEIRHDLSRQIREVVLARLRDDPEALKSYLARSKKIENRFNTLRRRSTSRAEDYAIQGMQKSYRVVQRDMNGIFQDPYLLNRIVRIKLLDPNYEQALLNEFEAAFTSFLGLINQELSAQERKIDRWVQIAPIVIPIPVVIAVMLVLFSRVSLHRGFVTPMRAIMVGTRRMSKGDLAVPLREGGVEEAAELARGINYMAEELEKSRDALVDTERQAALGSLVPVVAHNIRNPLAAIRANAQLLDHADQADEIDEAKTAIIETVDRLERWVTALVSYLHPLTPQMGQRVAASLFDASTRLLGSRLEESGISVVRDPWDHELMIEVDADLMEQAFYGLLSNAIDASPRHSTMRLGISADENSVEFTIADEGGGIPFNPEPSDLTPGPSTKRFGTGLGIPVAFKVCKAHGWDLKFDPVDGVGTNVTIKAPRTRSGANGDTW